MLALFVHIGAMWRENLPLQELLTQAILMDTRPHTGVVTQKKNPAPKFSLSNAIWCVVTPEIQSKAEPVLKFSQTSKANFRFEKSDLNQKAQNIQVAESVAKQKKFTGKPTKIADIRIVTYQM